jgi:hypothetical protein
MLTYADVYDTVQRLGVELRLCTMVVQELSAMIGGGGGVTVGGGSGGSPAKEGGIRASVGHTSGVTYADVC